MSEQAPQNSGGGMSPLRIILFLVLAAMIFALYWDRMVAGPAANKAYAAVEKMVSEGAAKPAEEEQPGREDVQKVIGREPTIEHDKDWYFVEEYHWQRGLPFRSYYVTVIYNKKEGGKKFTLANVELNQELEDISVPGGPAEPPKELPADAGQGDPATTEGEDAPLPPGVEPRPGDDTPSEDTPSEDTPAEEPPAEEPPAEEPPAEEPPAEEPPAEEPPAEEPPAEEPPAEEPPAEEPPAEEPPAEEPPAEEPPAEEPPAEEPPAEEPPAEEPPAEEPPAEEPPAEEPPAEDAPTEETSPVEEPAEESPADDAEEES